MRLKFNAKTERRDRGMLQLCNSVHNVHKSKKGNFLNDNKDLPYGKIYPYLSINHPHLWTFMDEKIHNLSLGNYCKIWRFMDYGQDSTFVS
jgi:hypothetical protein